jgi:protease I
MKVLIILAQHGYQDQEYAGTRKGLEEAGYAVTVASTEVGTCTGKFGGKVEATVALRNVEVTPFDKVAFIGGPGAAALADDEDAQQIARETVKQGKGLGAICIAPTILARAGVLKGKKATVWDNAGVQAALLWEEGAEYTGEDVTVDRKIVTANGPAAAEEFGRTLASL